jgi:hypothetical protein
MKKIFLACILIVSGIVYLTAGDPASKNDRNTAAVKKAEEISRSITRPEMTEFEKILILHEYISDRVEYGKLNDKTDSYSTRKIIYTRIC